MDRLRKIFLVLVILPLLLSGLFYSFYLAPLNQKPWVYIISMQSNAQSDLMNAVKLVNRLLYLNQSVYWVAEPLTVLIEGAEYTLAGGDFILTFYQNMQSYVAPTSTLSQSYLEGLFDELDVPLMKFHGNMDARVYALKHAKVAVFYGGGVTGGALEHIHPLEAAGFSVGIVREENLRRGELSQYDIVTFPGGGPYDTYLSDEDKETIKDFVNHGGGFLGTCGGSILGIKLGLLDAEAAIEGQYEAYADLRGPVLLNLTTSTNPIVYGCSLFVESMYFYGPFISKVGSNVETVSSYFSKTEGLTLYFPEIAKAYNYTPQTEIIDSFWGSTSIIAGKFGSGKVVLSTVHPEILQSSQRLFINSIFYLSCDDESLLRTSQNPLSQKTDKADLSTEDSSTANEALWSQLQTSASSLRDRASHAQEVLTGLENLNTQLVGVSGEYLQLFLDDIKTRSAELLTKLEELQNACKNLESAKTLLKHRQPHSLGLLLIYQDLLLSIERLQSRILSLQESMSNLSSLTNLIEIANDELLDEKSLLQQIEAGNLSTTQRYQRIINLNVAESLTLVKLKDEVDYHLLNWAFKTESILVETDMLIYISQGVAN